MYILEKSSFKSAQETQKNKKLNDLYTLFNWCQLGNKISKELHQFGLILKRTHSNLKKRKQKERQLLST